MFAGAVSESPPPKDTFASEVEVHEPVPEPEAEKLPRLPDTPTVPYGELLPLAVYGMAWWWPPSERPSPFFFVVST